MKKTFFAVLISTLGRFDRANKIYTLSYMYVHVSQRKKDIQINTPETAA